jgi:hypothetical protein
LAASISAVCNQALRCLKMGLGCCLSADSARNRHGSQESASRGSLKYQLHRFVSGDSASFVGITNVFTHNNRLQPLNISASSPSATVFSLNYDFHLGTNCI